MRDNFSLAASLVLDLFCTRADLDGSRAVQPPGRTPGELSALALVKQRAHLSLKLQMNLLPLNCMLNTVHISHERELNTCSYLA